MARKPFPPTPGGFLEQFRALRNLPAFFRMVWACSPWMAVGNLLLRLIQSFIPLGMLYVGKLLIDEVIALIEHGGGLTTYIWTLAAIEFGLAVASDLIGRAVNLLDSLLGDLFSNKTSVKLIGHAAALDLEQFEDATFYDKLDRARRQTVGRVVLMSQVLSQLQDTVTLLVLGTSLAAFNPWLLLILAVAVIPSFIGESHFNEKSYSLSRSWTPERRELDYLRYIGAGDETAKEVKIFGLSGFLSSRFSEISDRYYHANKKLNLRRAGWGSVMTAIGTLAYYSAYLFIIAETIAGAISVGSLTFLAGAFR